MAIQEQAGDVGLTAEILARLLEFDRELLRAPRRRPLELLVGTDEVGRGCLAGPVVAAAVILPPFEIDSELGRQLIYLNDSKQVHEQRRIALATTLQQVCHYAIAEATVAEVDELNILGASLLAMRRAVRRLKLSTPFLLAVDGNRKVGMRGPQITVIDGDTKSASIAAASIIAKVYRDALMKKLSRRFPLYNWDSNKGYRSRDHWKAINECGITKWHRRTFVEHWLRAPEDAEPAITIYSD